jgi:hypothetical protein
MWHTYCTLYLTILFKEYIKILTADLCCQCRFLHLGTSYSCQFTEKEGCFLSYYLVINTPGPYQPQLCLKIQSVPHSKPLGFSRILTVQWTIRQYIKLNYAQYGRKQSWPRNVLTCTDWGTVCKALVKIGISDGRDCHVMHSTCFVKDIEILFWPQQFPV